MLHVFTVVLLLLLYTIPTVFQLYLGGDMMYERSGMKVLAYTDNSMARTT